MRSAAMLDAMASETTTLASPTTELTNSSARQSATATKPLSTTEKGAFRDLVQTLIPCRNEDPELWFAEHTPLIDQAKELCQQCPLMSECLQSALDRQEPWGVWGGQSLVDGRIVARKRGRGRPRKDEAA